MKTTLEKTLQQYLSKENVQLNLEKLKTSIEKNKFFWQGILMIFLATVVAYWYIGGSRPYADEVFHYKQIRWFDGGNYQMVPNLTNIPGYHLVISLLTKIVGSSKMITIRFFSIILGIIGVPLFYAIYRSISKSSPQQAILRTLQFYFLPIFFPFFFLVYTDMFSLTLVLAAMLMMVKKRHVWAGIFAAASILVRQDNILWLVFIASYGYVAENNFSFAWQKITAFLQKIWVFILAMIGFAIFVVYNGGIAVGDKMHHEAGFYLGNVYFMLFMIFVFFLPYHIENLPKIVKRLKRYPALLLLPIVAVALFLFADPQLHPYNLTSKFLRNYTLMFIYSAQIYKFVYLLCGAYTILSLLEFGLTPVSYLLYPFAVVAVMPEWLIEQRYYIVALTFFMLFRKNKNTASEYALLGVYVIISIFFFYNISNTIFML